MNLRGEYIEISSEEEMEKASKWLESLGYKNLHDKKYDIEGTYLFISGDTMFHFNNESKKSYWKPFSVLYDEGMPRDKEEDLLSKAKRLYPIGTQYKCAAGGYNVHTVESMDWAPSPPDKIYGEDNKGCIYINGKWAEIVHEVKPIEKWSVDTYVVFLTDNLQGNFFKKGELARIYRSEPDDYRIWYSNQNTNNYDSDFVIENIKWFATLEEAEKFAATIKQSVEKKEFIPDDNLSSYIGRYLEALVDLPNGGKVKKGEYGLIINHSQANFPSQIGYHCSEALKKNNLNIRYRLMPEGFTPLVKEEEWKPQVGDWVVTDNLSNRMGGMYNGNLGQVWQIGKISSDWYKPVESMKFTGGSLELHNLRKATLAEINSVCKKEEVLTSNQTTYQPIVTSYSYNGVKETHQSINKTGRQFSPIKVELIKVKQLKIN